MEAMALENEMYLREGITTSKIKPRNRSHLAVARKVITTNKNYSPVSDFVLATIEEKPKIQRQKSLSNLLPLWSCHGALGRPREISRLKV